MKNTPTIKQIFPGYLFDLDGTIYLGDALLPTVRETLVELGDQGAQIIFISNNPTQTRSECARKLTRLGIPTREDTILISTQVMVDFLCRRMPGGRLFVIGEEPLCQELRRAGFVLTDQPGEIQAVIASFDRTFTYNKLQIAFNAIRLGASFFATNPDRYCPIPGGGEPDCAAVIAAIEACTGTQVEAVVGKPSRYIIESALKLIGLPTRDCLVTGDRLETDVKMGLDAGMAAALVLTGATSEVALSVSTIQPTFVLHQLKDLLP